MNFELTAEQKRIQAQARQFAEQEVAPVAREADEKGQFPLHLVKRMGELGFLAGPIEPEYGGARPGYFGFCPLFPERGGGGPFLRGLPSLPTPPPSPSLCALGVQGKKTRLPPPTGRRG